jgi:hypothetical protein
LERSEDGDCDEALVALKLTLFVGVGFAGDDIFGGNNAGGCLAHERDEVASDVFRGRVDIEKSGHFWLVWRFGYRHGGWWCMYGCSILEGIVGWQRRVYVAERQLQRSELKGVMLAKEENEELKTSRTDGHMVSLKEL